MKKTGAFVTPWEVSGKVDYQKLVKEFGLQKISPQLLARVKKHTKELHPMLSRGVFFAHRDLSWILDQYEKGNTFFLYTGRGPSDQMHLGHLLPLVFTKWLQDAFNVELWFQFTDDEKFLMKDRSYDEIQEQMYENMKDLIALGFNPKKTFFLIDTKHASIMYPEAIKVAKKITGSMVKASFGFTDSTNVGASFFTSMQAVPAFLPSVLKKKKIPCLIPHAVDQDPHFRLTRDILPKLGFYKPASIQCSFLPPLSGVSGKMSSSNEDTSAIYTTDAPNVVKKKMNKYAFSGGRDTLEEHRKHGGNPDVDVAFQYLKMFLEEDDAKLAQLEKDYRAGSLTSGELKKYAIEKINAFLKTHQAKRNKVTKKDIESYIYKH